jgi:hypothetical protein
MGLFPLRFELVKVQPTDANKQSVNTEPSLLSTLELIRVTTVDCVP